MTGHQNMRIVGDWGTTRLRLFQLRDGEVVDRMDGPGIGTPGLTPGIAWDEAISPWIVQARATGVTLCGMAGSRNGLHEAPYVDAPCDAMEWAWLAPAITRDGVKITLAAGMACRRDNGAPDVMRGEETQLFGALAVEPALGTGRHLVAMPGTHSKWAWVEDGRITGFRTFVTGEMFALLRTQSTLLRAGDDQADEDAGFAAGLARIAQHVDLLGALFEVRAAQLRDGRTAGWAAGFLSGLLIGAEVAAAVDRDTSVTLIGAPALTQRYRLALALRNIDARVIDGDHCAIAGLKLLIATREGEAG